MLSGFTAFPGGPRALWAYHSVKEAWRAQKVCANAWWLTGWLQRGRHESAGQTVGSRWFSEEEQEAIPDLCPRKKKKKKLSIRCIKQSSVEARWDYQWWSHSSIHALPDTVISSGAVCWASPCVTGSTHGSPRGSSYLHFLNVHGVNSVSQFCLCLSSCTELLIIFPQKKKSLFAAKEKVRVFVINVVEIQICPPQEGVFINSHSPEN